MRLSTLEFACLKSCGTAESGGKSDTCVFGSFRRCRRHRLQLSIPQSAIAKGNSMSLNFSLRCLSQIALTLLALGPSSSWPADRDVNLTFTDAWRKTVQVMALEGITITQSDKDAGVIQGTGTFKKESNSFKCSGLSGHVEGYRFSISVVLVQSSAPVTSISMTTQGVASSLKNNHLVFIKTGSSRHETPCESTGILEAGLLSRIASM